MSDIKIEPQWVGVGVAAATLGWAGIWAWRAYQRHGRRKALLARLERVAYAAAHQVQVPDGMGGFIHIDHLLLTPRGVLVLDTRRVAGLIFGADQMSDWTVMGRRRFTFDNPQPALYDRIAAVTITGSEAAGVSVAGGSGRALKKHVLELGGSDAYIVLADADVEAAAKMAVRARFQNNGQSCIAAKRFIVEDAVYDAFAKAFVTHTEALKAGDPEDRATTLGPVAREDLRDGLDEQVQKTISEGGKLLTGGKPLDRAGSYYAAEVGKNRNPDIPIVGDVKPGMPMCDEETFGPAAALTRARDAEHAIELANDSPYGLGGNLWTRDIARGKEIAKRLESGAVFINGMTASDPRLPFGGVKRSGYGRELSGFGIHEFVNIQTVWIGPAKDAATNTTPSE